MPRNHDRRVEKSVSNRRRDRSAPAGGAGPVLGFFACAALLCAPRTFAAAVPADTAGGPIAVEAPPAAGPEACSFRRPICVHGGPGALDALGALERAWEAGVVLGVPLPVTYDAYLAAEPSHSAVAERDLLSHVDRARTFSILDARLPDGCARDFDAARELYAASALGAAPAVSPGTLRAESTALARLAVPCEPIDAGVFQSHPERAIVDPSVAPGYDEGASLFFSFVDDAFAREPGRFITATLAMSPTHTPDDEHWVGEPDVFDVARASLKDAMSPGSTDADALLAFAVARGVVLEPRARLDWDVPWPGKPRRLASPEGVAPTGAAYVRVDTAGRKPGARFDLDATWEQLATMRWMVVKLDASGRETGRIEARAAPKATHAHLQVVDLDGASALLVVAANVGPWTRPFDPDDAVWEPHGWLLTISSEGP
jgi:hypothetical protein